MNVVTEYSNASLWKVPVAYSRTGPIGTISFDQRPQENSWFLTNAMTVKEGLARLNADQDVSVGVLSSVHGTEPGSRDHTAYTDASGMESQDQMIALHRIDKILVAAIGVHTYNFLKELFLGCDFVVADENAVFNGLERIRDTSSDERKGQELTAYDAYELGIVDRVVESGEASRAAIALGEKISWL